MGLSMELSKLLEERQKRIAFKNAIERTIKDLDFTKPIKRSIVHEYVCNLLGLIVSNKRCREIRDQLIAKEIVPARSGSKCYYRHVEYTKGYSWLKFKHLKFNDSQQS
jgi:hypothetical protein